MRYNRRFLVRYILALAAAVFVSPVFSIAETAPVSAAPTALPVYATLQLRTDDRRLYADIVVEAPFAIDAASRYIIVKWMPPAHSYCKASQYTLPYHGEIWHTRGFRTMAHVVPGTKGSRLNTCHGLWTVIVKDRNGMPLTEAAIQIAESAPIVGALPIMKSAQPSTQGRR